MKRTFDILMAGSGLIIMSIPMAVISLFVRWKLGPPVLYRQVRPGLNGEPFQIMKFRTMTDARSSDGSLLPDSMRLTALGSFLRRTSMDELPELLNVLRGDMSLVGPRPLLTRYMPHFTREEMSRFSVRPGLTGWAQVHGRNDASWDERLAMDVWYVANQSLWLDFRILTKTLLRVVSGSGVVVDPNSTMRDLDQERMLRN